MDLREKTIEIIRTHGVDMSKFGNLKDAADCGTVCCLAGAICKAGHALGMFDAARGEEQFEFPKLLQGDPDYSPSDDLNLVPQVARYLWSKSYGRKEANRLGFYAHDWARLSLHAISVEQVVNHINGALTPLAQQYSDEKARLLQQLAVARRECNFRAEKFMLSLLSELM